MSMLSVDCPVYSYDKYREDLMCLQSVYPEWCCVRRAGESVFGKNIYHVTLGNPDAFSHLVVLANLHAREYMTTQLCMKQIEYYLANYNARLSRRRISDILEQTAIHFFPSCNPDGTAISQFEPGLKRWKANGRGVDLNRNFDSPFWYLWKEGNRGLSGERPESEPEVKALLHAISEIEKYGAISGIISYHASGSVIYGACNEWVESRVRKTTEQMTKLARSLTGYKLMPVEKREETLGCSREYFLYRRKIPFITIEIGRGECPLQIEEIHAVWKENKELVIRTAEMFIF